MDSTLLRSKALPTPKDNNLVKIAVEMTGKTPQLIEFNQKQPLSTIIQELCNYWNLIDADSYALRFNMEASRAFVSEQNRLEEARQSGRRERLLQLARELHSVSSRNSAGFPDLNKSIYLK